MYPVIFDDAFISVERADEHGTLLLRRTSHPVDSSADILDSYSEALKRAAEFQGWGLILDLRKARGRNDGEFESGIAAMNPVLNRTFRCVVLLVATAAGILQIQRLAREEGREALVARTEADALRLAQQQLR